MPFTESTAAFDRSGAHRAGRLDRENGTSDVFDQRIDLATPHQLASLP